MSCLEVVEKVGGGLGQIFWQRKDNKKIGKNARNKMFLDGGAGTIRLIKPVNACIHV